MDKWVSSRLYPTRIEVVADDALIASHVRLLDRDQVSYDWQHYLPLIERKRVAFHCSLLDDRKAIFDLLLRAEAWLGAAAERRASWGGSRVGAGRPEKRLKAAAVGVR